jgi:hypothetical protein
MPEDGIIVVNYGDEGRKPRPHLLYGWTPEGKFVDVPDWQYIRSDGYHTPVAISQFMDWIIESGRRIRREYRGEWVQSDNDRQQ